MKELKDWLSSNRGMATRLCKKLGINATNVSSWASGRKNIPTRHMRKIVKFSKGQISLTRLLDYQEQFASRQT